MTIPSTPSNGNELINEEIKPTLEAVAMPYHEVDVSFDRGDMNLKRFHFWYRWSQKGSVPTNGETLNLFIFTGRSANSQFR